MTPADSPQQEYEEVDESAGRLAAILRLVLGAAGIAGLGIACYVVADSKDGTATAALILAAVLLLFVAAFGNRITSLRYGDMQIDLAASFLVRARAARARGDTQAESRLVGAALDAAGISTGLSSAIDVTSTRRLHRDAVFNALAAVPGVTVTYSGTPIDGLVTTNQAKIGVDVRAGPKSSEKSVERFQKLQAKRADIEALLIVVPKGKATRLTEVADELGKRLDVPVEVVRWTAENDSSDSLKEALQKLEAATHK
jgi:hypothetical protein